MNILFIQASNTIGGAEMSLIDLIKYLSSNGVNCFVVLKKCKKNLLGKLLEQELGNNVFCFRSIPLIPRMKSQTTFLESLKNYIYKFYKNGPDFISIYKLKKIAKNNNINLIHTNTVYPTLGKIISKKYKVPHVQHLRELTAGIGGIVNFKFQDDSDKFKTIFGTHDGIIANSNYCINSNEPWYTSKNKMVMYNSVNQSFFDITNEKLNHNIGLVANVTANWKRHDIYIKLAEVYSKKYNDGLNFLIYGNLPNQSNNYFDKLNKSIKIKKLKNIVKFEGSVKSKNIYNNIKLLVHCCPTEPFGRIFIEAAASGVPVVAIKGGGASEIVNKNLGFLFTEKQLEGMADKIYELVNFESKRLHVANKAKIEAVKYLPINIYKDIIPFYKKIINESAAKS